MHDVVRICAHYSVPREYSSALGIGDELLRTYDPETDFRSASLNAETLFSNSKQSLWGCTSAACRDNLSRVKDLLPGYSAPDIQPRAARAEKRRRRNEPSLHIFDSVAQLASRVKSGYASSPMSLLLRAKEERIRIRIVTRNESSIRSTVEAYLLMFDRHFNLILEDVKETIAVLGTSYTVA